jgi:hypothetical protein
MEQTSMEQTNSYRHVALHAVQEAGVPGLLGRNPSGAVVLERIAYSAGATRWYYLRDATQLAAVADLLSSSSCVSFYFDGRLAVGPWTRAVMGEIVHAVRLDGDALVGQLIPDEIEIDMNIVSSVSELGEFAGTLPLGATVIYGRFPGRDNDGERAVTLDLPDRDGLVRQHPH